MLVHGALVMTDVETIMKLNFAAVPVDKLQFSWVGITFLGHVFVFLRGLLFGC